MAVSTARIIGRDLAITAASFGTITTITIWQNFRLNFTADTENATAADSVLNEVVITTKMVELTASFLQGSINNSATLPGIGASITTLAVAVGADSVIPSMTAYTNMKVLTCNYDFVQGPATAELTARSGVLNSIG